MEDNRNIFTGKSDADGERTAPVETVETIDEARTAETEASENVEGAAAAEADCAEAGEEAAAEASAAPDVPPVGDEAGSILLDALGIDDAEPPSFDEVCGDADINTSEAGGDVEVFVPTEYFAGAGKKRLGRGAIAAIVAGALVLALAVAGLLYFNALKNDPGAFFGVQRATPAPTAEAMPTAPAEETAAPAAEATEEPTPTPTIDPYTALEQRADTSIMKNTLNVAVIGVDYAEERLTGYGGKADDNAFHADVILILAINFDENRVDMISIPRDTYAKIPGVRGIYKINASLDCGGGLFAENGAGFEKVCEAAEWMLGGIPVDYYYAVTMPAVKELADAVGGVDYDMDIEYRIQGRKYVKGMQHLDGQGVLDYLRVRKNVVGTGDNNRVNRQKRLLIALFKKMQEQNLILKIPDILAAFKGQLFTNTNPSQTAALALFAYKLDAENIGMHSMGSGKNGTSGNTNIFNWNFCLTDQANRVRIIREIYGVDVPQYKEYTKTYARYRWASMLVPQYLDTCRPLTNHVQELLAVDDLLPIAPLETEIPIITPEPSIDPSVTPPPAATPTPDVPATPDVPIITPDVSEPEPIGSEEVPIITPEGEVRANTAGIVRLSYRPTVRFDGDVIETRKYTEEQRALFDEYLRAIQRLEDHTPSQTAPGASEKLLEEVKSLAIRVAREFGYPEKKLVWTVRYEYDRDFNEIRVNFN